MVSIYLPDTNKSVENKNEQDDERFNKGCDGVIVFKEGQDLQIKDELVFNPRDR